jgi:hypothetical protein
VAAEPDNLVFEDVARDARHIDEHTKRFEAHDRRFDELHKAIEDWQETTSTGAGFAMHANIRTQGLKRK